MSPVSKTVINTKKAKWELIISLRKKTVIYIGGEEEENGVMAILNVVNKYCLIISPWKKEIINKYFCFVASDRVEI